MAAVKKSQNKTKKNRKNKIHLVFDEAKRREFLTGFRKRKLQRKKEAQEKLERDLKEERKRLKIAAKESYKKLVVSHRPIPELETLLKEEYEEDNATVRIEELSTNKIALDNNWIGANHPKINEAESEEENEEVPGMGLTATKKKKEERKFDTERDVKRLLKKEATKKVKKSKVFQMKNKVEKQKQKKKSLQMKKQRMKVREKKTKKKH